MSGKKLPVEAYEEAWVHYREVQTIDYVAKKTGRDWKTVEKWVKVGDPDRNLAPLAERFRDWMAEIREKLDRPAAEVRADKIRKLDIVFDRTFENFLTRQQGYVPVITSDTEKACDSCGKPLGVDYLAVKPHLATPHDLADVAKAIDNMLGGQETAIVDKVQNLSILMIQTWTMTMIPLVSFYLERLRAVAETIDIEIDPEMIPDPEALVTTAANEVADRLLAIAKGDS